MLRGGVGCKSVLDGRSERSKNVPSLRGSLNFIHSFILFIFTSFICLYPLSFPHTHTLKQGALENKLRHREAEKGLESCVCVYRHPRACKALCTWGSLCCVWTWVWGVLYTQGVGVHGHMWSGVLHARGGLLGAHKICLRETPSSAPAVWL